MLGLNLSPYGNMWFIVWCVLCLVFAIGFQWYANTCDKKHDLRYGIFTFIVLFLIGFSWASFCSWRNTNTAQGARFIKDMKSEFNNGLDREITIYSEEGREIYKYDGKIDLKVNQDSRDLEFIDAEGKKQIIIFGVQDTAIIKEK